APGRVRAGEPIASALHSASRATTNGIPAATAAPANTPAAAATARRRTRRRHAAIAAIAHKQALRK
ncbi:hypothetical protein AFM18_29485, partial [Achromobacter spanius]